MFQRLLGYAISALAITVVAVTAGIMAAAIMAPTCPNTSTPEVQPDSWQQPYGGCDEAYLYPKSRGYAECVAHGFIEEK